MRCRDCGHDLCVLIRSGEAARLRVAAGISQRRMAAALGIKRETFSLLERNRQRPHLALAGRYARVLRGLANHEEGTRATAEAWARMAG